MLPYLLSKWSGIGLAFVSLSSLCLSSSSPFPCLQNFPGEKKENEEQKGPEQTNQAKRVKRLKRNEAKQAQFVARQFAHIGRPPSFIRSIEHLKFDFWNAAAEGKPAAAKATNIALASNDCYLSALVTLRLLRTGWPTLQS